MDKIGLIAGNRRFPIVFSEAAKKKNCSIVAVAIKGETSRQLKKYVDRIHWISLSDFRAMFEIFKVEGVKKIVMAGQISPYRLFSREVNQNIDLKKLLDSIKDRKANTIFEAIADRLKEFGFELIDSTTFIDDMLPKKAVLTAREPSLEEWDNIHFGMPIAKEIARLDIGLTIAVKNKAVVAVEALEGTDNLIRRAGSIARGGMVIIKVSRPDQDMRFDIPVIGLNTIKTLMRSGACCMAIESNKTLFIDQEASVKLADRGSVSIVSV